MDLVHLTAVYSAQPRCCTDKIRKQTLQTPLQICYVHLRFLVVSALMRLAQGLNALVQGFGHVLELRVALFDLALEIELVSTIKSGVSKNERLFGAFLRILLGCNSVSRDWA